MNYKAKTPVFIFSLLIITSFAASQDLQDILEDEDEELTDLEEIYDTETVIHQFDDSTNLVDYNFHDGNKTVFVFYSDISRTVDIFDVNAFRDEGGETPPINNFRLESGFTAVEVDLTRTRGDKTAFMTVGESYYTQSNRRTSALIGTPDESTGFVAGILGGGIAVLFIIVVKIKYKQYKIDESGVRLH